MNVISKVTLKGLYKNRTRTIVTIIGVILSAAMFTAVTTLISSFQNYMVNLAIAEEGNWYAAFHEADYNGYLTLSGEEEVEAVGLSKGLGYSALKESANQNKPYLYFIGMDEAAFDILPVVLVSGRLPQNENEVIISETISTNAGVKYQVGDTLKLELGRRELEDGTILQQKDSFADGQQERLVYESTREFTIVGVMKRLSYKLESFSAPGYSVITRLSENTVLDSDDLDIYFRIKNPANIYTFIDSLTKSGFSMEQVEYNSALLRDMGISDHGNFLSVLYGLCAVLIGLIMVGSVSLIYNSFSISVSERKKQFGMLSSIGATSRQLRRSVLFEALFIAGIGIPLGILSGILGIGVTLHYLSGLFSSLLATDAQVTLTLSISEASIAVAAVVSLCTILISAYIPARAIARVSAMDAIRQTTDIKLTSRQVKTGRVWRKLFGMEGDLALKNMRRNRRRYRSTVFSLCISIVLFISATSYSMYLKESVENVYVNQKYDLSYYAGNNASEDNVRKAYKSILELDSVDQGVIVWNEPFSIIELTRDQLDESYYQELKENYYSDDGNIFKLGLSLNAVDHDTFTGYISALGLDKSMFENSDEPAGIIVDNQHYYSYEQERFRNIHAFRSHKPQRVTIGLGESNEVQKDVNIAFADTAPFGIPDYSGMNNVLMIVDESMMEVLSVPGGDTWESQYMFFAAEDPFKAETEIKDILTGAGMNTSYLNNTAEALQSTRNLITIISVFAYGFIVLISLITIANVFNTISTNVNLRRREFAMLKSVGMTDKSFNRMLNFECIFYGLKSLLFGLPLSIAITCLIYRSINEGVDMSFHLPAQGILISVFSVFVVVFVSMMYSLSKIRRKNILDALRNENL